MSVTLPMTRPDWQLYFIRMAYATAERGSCLRKQVGAIIVRDLDRRIIAGGYNGAPRGMPDCLGVGCDVRVIDGRPGCVRTLHAESNALDLAGPMFGPHTIYTTVIPCRLCALRIIQAGIARCVFHEYYESQGTKEVKDLFYGTGVGPVPRVELVHYNVPEAMVKPMWPPWGSTENGCSACGARPYPRGRAGGQSRRIRSTGTRS